MAANKDENTLTPVEDDGAFGKTKFLTIEIKRQITFLIRERFHLPKIQSIRIFTPKDFTPFRVCLMRLI